MGKQNRDKFSSGKYISIGILEYIYSYLWGPTWVKSHSGCNYFVTFIDDYSRKVCMFFLSQWMKCLGGSRSGRPWLKNILGNRSRH